MIDLFIGSKNTKKHQNNPMHLYGINTSQSAQVQKIDFSSNNIFLPNNAKLAEEASKITVNNFLNKTIEEQQQQHASFEDGVLLGVRLSTYVNKIHHDANVIVSSILTNQSLKRRRDDSESETSCQQQPNKISSYTKNRNTISKLSEQLATSSIQEAVRNTFAAKNQIKDKTQNVQSTDGRFNQITEDDDDETQTLKRAFNEYKM